MRSAWLPVLFLSASSTAFAQEEDPEIVLAFGTMYGVEDAFLGDENPIRGIAGDDLPWEVERVRGLLQSDGHLRILVRGLVFSDDPSVPEELRGINDEPFFRALVSCLTIEEGKVRVVNRATRRFLANIDGDSWIDAHVALPESCFAPIVMVGSGSSPVWFAVTGVDLD